MPTQSLWEAGALLEVARTLSPLQRQIICSLRDRGPGLLLEVAVRVLHFPEEVREPLADLRDKRLVTIGDPSGSGFGSDLVSLTPQGEQLAIRLREETFQKQLQQPETVVAAASPGPADLRQQELELLRKLGELARENGDREKALEYYEQALVATRRLAATEGS